MTTDAFPEDGGFRKMPTLRHVSVGSSIGYAIHEYYVQEAMLLDQMQYADWATLLTQDLKYNCPATLFHPASTVVSEFVERDRGFLLRHLRSSFKDVERSRSAQSVRRLITNVLVSGGDSPKEYSVKTYVLLTGTSDAGSPLMMTVERHDVLRRCSYTYQIARREVRFGASSMDALGVVRIL